MLGRANNLRAGAHHPPGHGDARCSHDHSSKLLRNLGSQWNQGVSIRLSCRHIYLHSRTDGKPSRGAVWIVVLLINALLTIGQIIALYRQHLRAWALAGLSIVQSIPLAIAYILNIVYAARQEGNTGATVGATLINTVFL